MGTAFTAGDLLSGPTLRDRCFPTVAVMPADQTLNNSTESTPMAGFSLMLEGNTHYAFDGYIAYSTNATADIAWVIYGAFGDGPFGSALSPSVASWTFATVHVTEAGNPGALDGAFLQRVDGDFTFGGFGGAGSGTPEMAARPHGWVNPGPSPGLIQFFFRQNVANASNTTVKAGSWLRFTKLGTG